jgi:hypothetical protein
LSTRRSLPSRFVHRNLQHVRLKSQQIASRPKLLPAHIQAARLHHHRLRAQLLPDRIPEAAHRQDRAAPAVVLPEVAEAHPVVAVPVEAARRVAQDKISHITKENSNEISHCIPCLCPFHSFNSFGADSARCSSHLTGATWLGIAKHFHERRDDCCSQ